MSLGYKIACFISWAIAGGFTLATTILGFQIAWCNNEEVKAKKRVHARAWIKLARARKRDLPRRAIEWVLCAKTRADKWVEQTVASIIILKHVNQLTFLSTLALGSFAFWQKYSHSGTWVIILYWICTISVIDVILAFWGLGVTNTMAKIRYIDFSSPKIIYTGMGCCVGYIAIISVDLVFPLIWIAYVVTMNIWMACALLFITTIYLLIVFGMSGRSIQNLFFLDKTSFQGSWIAISFIVTCLALWFGVLLSPQSPLPQDMQMLLWNVACDGLTLYFTFIILKNAVSDNPRFSIGMAVLLDITIAIVLAGLSLWLGTFHRASHLGLLEVVTALVGRNATNTAWEFGPYFWAMHTTFIPTLIYMGVIYVLYVAKLVVHVRTCWLWRLSIREPYKLTAALLGVLAMATTLIAAGLQLWHKLFIVGN